MRHYRNSLGIHSDPSACTGICFRVTGVKKDAAIVRSSLGLRYLFAAVPFAAYEGSNDVRRRLPGRLKRDPHRRHQPFDEQPSIIGYLRTEPWRSRIEAPTNCGRFAPSLRATQAKTDASACAWIAVDIKTVPVVAESILKKFFGDGARTPPSSAPGKHTEGVYSFSINSLD